MFSLSQSIWKYRKTRWVNNFPQKCQFKSFDQWKLTLIFSPYKPELSMIRSCPNHLEFKNELFHCKPVNQQKISIFALILWEEQRQPFLKRKKVPKLYFHFWPPKKCPPFFFLIHTGTWWYENITASPCAANDYYDQNQIKDIAKGADWDHIQFR